MKMATTAIMMEELLEVRVGTRMAMMMNDWM